MYTSNSSSIKPTLSQIQMSWSELFFIFQRNSRVGSSIFKVSSLGSRDWSFASVVWSFTSRIRSFTSSRVRAITMESTSFWSGKSPSSWPHSAFGHLANKTNRLSVRITLNARIKFLGLSISNPFTYFTRLSMCTSIIHLLCQNYNCR